MKLRDEEIRQADEVLKYLKENNVISTGLHPHPNPHPHYEITGRIRRYIMNNLLCDELGLISHSGDTYRLTLKGRDAAEVGIMAYLEEQERNAKKPVPTKEVDDRPWWKLTKEGWISLATLITTVVFGISNCCG